jgi:hypothetical protein
MWHWYMVIWSVDLYGREQDAYPSPIASMDIRWLSLETTSAFEGQRERLQDSHLVEDQTKEHYG